MVYGELNDRLAPGAPYVEAILEHVEEGTLEVVPLSQVLCVEDGEEAKHNAVIDPSGVVRIKRGRQKGRRQGGRRQEGRRQDCGRFGKLRPASWSPTK